MGESLFMLETPDGRELAFALWGDPDGFPVFVDPAPRPAHRRRGGRRLSVSLIVVA